MDFNDDYTRLVGDYLLGPRIGSGSFAVVWRSKHRVSGWEVAVKEIDKKLLSPKVSENLFKEISILSTINHPNIIRLFDSIQTKDRIFLVLEYCDGGDLAEYIQRHQKVSKEVARHFMRQLAAGLQVLQEKHLIHRDLKPQNLFLLSNDATPQLKIGDFGFARSLIPQDLADTLCGSPLYMAPEIIQNQKYDAKADLWSVGAILFQLVTGKPPFDGKSHYQLFQNILTSTELHFPPGALDELHPDCVDLCRKLLRQNPVERLTFKEFFNHKFLGKPRLTEDVKPSSTLPKPRPPVDQFDASASGTRSQLLLEHKMYSANTGNPKLMGSSAHDNLVVHEKELGSASGTKSVHESVPTIMHDRMRKSADGGPCSSDQLGVADSTESIEKDYVLVNHYFASLENFSYYLGTSLQDSSATNASVCPSKENDQNTAVTMHTKEVTTSSVGRGKSPLVHESDPLATSGASTILKEVQGPSILHPSTRLQRLYEYVQAVSEIAQEKCNEGLFLESFSVELVVLAIWKKALQICSSWLASTTQSELPESSSANESIHGGTESQETIDKIDFLRPSSACEWAEQGFILAFDRAEKLSYHLKDMDAAAEMPDAMEVIFQKALAVGRSGAVDEYMENKDSASLSYSKAMILLSFVVGEATSLPLNPPFSLTPANKKRIQSYIINLQSHQSHFLMVQPISKQSPDSLTK